MNRILLSSLLVLLFAFTSLYSQEYYLGTGNGSEPQNTSCASCHKSEGIAQPIYEEWKETAHATAQDAMTASYYNYSCLKCHNTGWDESKVNYGADEYVKLDTTQKPNYVITDAAGWNKVKNVGCESCHGPLGQADGQMGSKHWTQEFKPDFSSELCGQCHQDGHHPYMEQWTESAHAKSGVGKSYILNNKSCVKCHVAQNFAMYAQDPVNYKDTLLVTAENAKPITCVACHDPHSKKNEGQLRFAGSVENTICDECHTTGTDVVNINKAPHQTTAEVLTGTSYFGYQYPGQTYVNSGHTFAARERCVNCHVYRTEFDGTMANTGHSFEARVEACVSCHTDYLAKTDVNDPEKKFDYRGIQSKTTALMDQLKGLLANASSQDSTTDVFKQANYNLKSIQKEGSRGVHNTRLVQKLLKDAIVSMGGVLSVEQEESTGLLTTFELEQNYPNPFNPETKIKFTVPSEGNVKLAVYDASGQEAAVLVNENLGQGKYTVSWNGTGFASGIYFYRIEAKDFTMVKKMVLVK